MVAGAAWGQIPRPSTNNLSRFWRRIVAPEEWNLLHGEPSLGLVSEIMIAFISRAFRLLVVFSVLMPLAAGAAGEPERPLYAFENGLGFGSPGEEAQFLKDGGYAGVSQVKQTGEALGELVSTYEKAGLRVLSVYLDASERPVDPALVKALADRGAMIELTVRKFTPTTVESVGKTCEMAAEMNIRVVLYPHFGFGIATIPQAMELISKVDHPNLGVMLNLCHYLKSENPDDLESSIELVGDRLFAVSVSGADVDGKDWNSLIQTLDSGTFPQRRLLTALGKASFEGPVALQCYNVKGDKRENLKKSMAAWTKLTADPE
jgi:hypothetical protein